MTSSDGSMHGRAKGQPAALTLAQLFPAKPLAGTARGRGGHGKGRTKHGKVGMHGRGRSGDALPWQAKQDPWKHKGQAVSHGGLGVKR